MTSEAWTALRLSFQVACAHGWADFHWLSRLVTGWPARGSPASGSIEAVVNLPLVLPPVVTGYLMLVLLAPRGPIGAVLQGWFGVKIVFTWWGPHWPRW